MKRSILFLGLPFLFGMMEDNVLATSTDSTVIQSRVANSEVLNSAIRSWISSNLSQLSYDAATAEEEIAELVMNQKFINDILKVINVPLSLQLLTEIAAELDKIVNTPQGYTLQRYANHFASLYALEQIGLVKEVGTGENGNRHYVVDISYRNLCSAIANLPGEEWADIKTEVAKISSLDGGDLLQKVKDSNIFEDVDGIGYVDCMLGSATDKVTQNVFKKLLVLDILFKAKKLPKEYGHGVKVLVEKANDIAAAGYGCVQVNVMDENTIPSTWNALEKDEKIEYLKNCFEIEDGDDEATINAAIDKYAKPVWIVDQTHELNHVIHVLLSMPILIGCVLFKGKSLLPEGVSRVLPLVAPIDSILWERQFDDILTEVGESVSYYKGAPVLIIDNDCENAARHVRGEAYRTDHRTGIASSNKDPNYEALKNYYSSVLEGE